MADPRSPATFTSPAAALTARWRMESDAMRVAVPGGKRYLLDVESLALTGNESLTAGLFDLVRPNASWDRNFVDPVTSVLSRVIGLVRPPLGRSDEVMGRFLDGARSRLSGLPISSEALNTATIVLSQGAAEKWPRQRLARELSLALDWSTATHGKTWSEAIERAVRTEATATHNMSSLTTLNDTGMQMKRWVSHHDRFVRPTHLAADGQSVPLSDPFIVGGAALMHPGDPDGPAQETANCRCVIVGA